MATTYYRPCPQCGTQTGLWTSPLGQPRISEPAPHDPHAPYVQADGQLRGYNPRTDTHADLPRWRAHDCQPAQLTLDEGAA